MVQVQDSEPGQNAVPAPKPCEPSKLSLGRLRISQLAVIAVLALSLPAGAVAVFGLDADRGVTADVVGLVFFLAILLLLSTPWWPLPSLAGCSTFDRVQSMCFL